MHDMEALKQRFDGAKTALAQRRRRNERVRKHLNQLTAALDRLPVPEPVPGPIPGPVPAPVPTAVPATVPVPAGLEDLRAEIGRLAVENRRLRGLVVQHQTAEAAQQPEVGRPAPKSDVARLLGDVDDEDETDVDAGLRPPATRIREQDAAQRQGTGSAAASEIVQGLIRELDEDPADAPE